MVSCGKTPTKESLIEDECENTNHHTEIVSKTDSILSVADKKIDKIGTSNKTERICRFFRTHNC